MEYSGFSKSLLSHIQFRDKTQSDTTKQHKLEQFRNFKIFTLKTLKNTISKDMICAKAVDFLREIIK